MSEKCANSGHSAADASGSLTRKVAPPAARRTDCAQLIEVVRAGKPSPFIIQARSVKWPLYNSCAEFSNLGLGLFSLFGLMVRVMTVGEYLRPGKAPPGNAEPTG